MALPINKDIAQEIAKKKAKEQIAKKEALNVKKLNDNARKSKTLPKTSGIIDIKAVSQTVNASLPDNQKPKGLSKLGNILTNQGLQLASTALPLVQQYALQLGIEKIQDNLPNACPSQANLNIVIEPIRNIIEQLNSTADFVSDINDLMTKISTGATVIATTSTILDTLIPTLSAAVKVIPPPGLPGAVVAAVDDVDYANKKLLYKKDGTPRLPEILVGIGSVTVATSLISFYIKSIKDPLDKIINVLKICSPTTTLPSLNSSVETLVRQQEQSSANQDNLYKGFLLKIIEVKFNEQLNRRKAVAYNGNGIPTLETELSFTTNTQTLVEELKQIIDESGLVGDYIPSPQPRPLEEDLLPEAEGNKEVRLSIIKERIRKIQVPLDATTKEFNQAVDRFLKQQKLDAYLRQPIPNYLLPITFLNYNTNANLVQSFANEVGYKKQNSNVTETSVKTVERNVPILLDLFKQIKPLLDKVTSLENSLRNQTLELDLLEGRVSKEDSSISSGQVAIIAR
jgi:hypothetical protein